MLAYFPEIYPHELLYSVLARFRRHVGTPNNMFVLDALFGNRKTSATFDFPGYLQNLVAHIPAERGVSVDELIDGHTLFPYFTAYEPPEIQLQVREAMLRGAIANVHLRLGLAAFRVSRNVCLRFCPECLNQMMASYGECYWRRDHQLPGILVCAVHGCPLIDSMVALTNHSRHEFVAATLGNCLVRVGQTMPGYDNVSISHLWRLAKCGAQALIAPPRPLALADWTAFYRKWMVFVGLARSSCRMCQGRLREEFGKFYGHTLGLLPNMTTEAGEVGCWLAAMVRKHRKASHPLCHLLLQDFLTQYPHHSAPFGVAPWPCLNPLSLNCKDTPADQIRIHKNHGHLVGVFECRCGYAYTRSFFPSTKTTSSPRFLHFGPLLEPALRRHVETGAGLRATARALGIDPKTVARLAHELAIPTSWLYRPIQGKRRMPARMSTTSHLVAEHASALSDFASPGETDRTRRDWIAIDQVLSVQFAAIATTIRLESPPIRVSLAELERRTNRRGWFEKRRHKLPRAAAALAQVVEDTPAFQRRRIQWALEELEREGQPVKAWQVMRKAGLQGRHMEDINAYFDSLPVESSVDNEPYGILKEEEPNA